MGGQMDGWRGGRKARSWDGQMGGWVGGGWVDSSADGWTQLTVDADGVWTNWELPKRTPQELADRQWMRMGVPVWTGVWTNWELPKPTTQEWA